MQSTTASVLTVLCVKDILLQPVVFLPSLLSDGSWHWPLSPQSRAGWLCPGSQEESLSWEGGTAWDLSLHGCSCALGAAVHDQQLCAVSGVQLRACSTPGQGTCGEP